MKAKLARKLPPPLPKGVLTRPVRLAKGDHTTGFLKHVATVLGSEDVEIIVAEYTLAGIAPGMDSLTESKSISILAAQSAARERAA